MEGEIVYEITTSSLSTGLVSHLQINISTDTMSAKLLVHFSRKKKNGYLSFNSFSKGERLEGEKCKKGLKQ